MKFLVDECTGIGVSEKLKQMNFDTVSAIECMKGAEDTHVIKRAVKEGRVLITNDKGLSRLASFYKPPGIILLRLKDESAKNKVKVVSFIVSSHCEAILGNLIVVSEKKVRLRRLSGNSKTQTV